MAQVRCALFCCAQEQDESVKPKQWAPQVVVAIRVSDRFQGSVQAISRAPLARKQGKCSTRGDAKWNGLQPATQARSLGISLEFFFSFQVSKSL